MGIVTGDMLVNGQPRDASFQRKTGYVQQQDIHLASSTIREALEFSALLRQGAHIPRAEKLAYVDEVLKLLDMEEYADAIIGVPGEGLNIEQRKRLTIGIELAARPQLLLFLDEPTSGLDSQTSWAICDLMQKLTNNGQAILCTIHQPSAMLFQRFDRLLLLAKGGRTVYFGGELHRYNVAPTRANFSCCRGWQGGIYLDRVSRAQWRTAVSAWRESSRVDAACDRSGARSAHNRRLAERLAVFGRIPSCETRTPESQGLGCSFNSNAGG